MSEETDYQEEHGGNVFTVEVRDGDELVRSASVQVSFHRSFLGILGGSSPTKYTDDAGQAEFWVNCDCRATIYVKHYGRTAQLDDVWIEDGSGFTVSIGENDD